MITKNGSLVLTDCTLIIDGQTGRIYIHGPDNKSCVFFGGDNQGVFNFNIRARLGDVEVPKELIKKIELVYGKIQFSSQIY